VVGLGTSGYWAARWLASKGARVVVSDMREASRLDPEYLDELDGTGVVLETGGHHEESFLGADAMVVSPGVPLDMPFIQTALKRRIPLLGEMELAARFVEAPIIAVTGTNGKTTVTAFLGQLLENSGFHVFVGGNIGTPLTAFLAREEKADYVVVEVSSFQLDTMDRFSPEISIILNISPDHLDRYANYQAYIQSKLRIFENQGSGQTVILNNDDPVLSKVIPPGKATLLRYGLKKTKGMDAYIEKGEIHSSVKDESRFSLKCVLTVRIAQSGKPTGRRSGGPGP
jgi:UDP-N-acetylmuramoylalanine--D-glutamate ligase